MKAVPVLPAARFDLASFGELVSDPSRVAMLLALMDGTTRPATELASIAGISPSTASFHLARLVTGALVRVEPSGRHRYFRLASDDVADALEAVALIHPRRREATPSSTARRADTTAAVDRRAVEDARTCYRHLAGRLGVAWLGALGRTRFVDVDGGALALTRRGIAWFEASGLSPSRWPDGKTCLDWTERKYHLGGPLGVLLTDHLFSLTWLARHKDGRAVRVTATGDRELARHFALR